ncbi:hypothetical protein [Pseudooceanicola sp. LIPI14-2-Ac024]|uniref:hypothetical protein n=1 Tax=Pseudooceanicola sp. LIPI14-2-Ac024 TaxID=3344875 RepID=UPI0035CF0D2C
MSDFDAEVVARLREQNSRLQYDLVDTQLKFQLHLSKARWVITKVMAYVADDKTRADVEELLRQIDQDMKTSGDVYETAPGLHRTANGH